MRLKVCVPDELASLLSFADAFAARATRGGVVRGALGAVRDGVGL
jgi:hypothetical protein